ncbi:MAG: hypothetical protein KDB92_04725, partial [Chitinophagaceae bacterium]|nr:hypothetical protein [Chitinophagaceae bacterium]
MKLSALNISKRKYLLLLLAILSYILSLVFNTVYTNFNSINHEVSKAEQYIHQHEKSFRTIIKDTALLSKLVAKTESYGEFTK